MFDVCVCSYLRAEGSASETYGPARAHGFKMPISHGTILCSRKKIAKQSPFSTIYKGLSRKNCKTPIMIPKVAPCSFPPRKAFARLGTHFPPYLFMKLCRKSIFINRKKDLAGESQIFMKKPLISPPNMNHQDFPSRGRVVLENNIASNGIFRKACFNQIFHGFILLKQIHTCSDMAGNLAVGVFPALKYMTFPTIRPSSDAKSKTRSTSTSPRKRAFTHTSL